MFYAGRKELDTVSVFQKSRVIDLAVFFEVGYIWQTDYPRKSETMIILIAVRAGQGAE